MRGLAWRKKLMSLQIINDHITLHFVQLICHYFWVFPLFSLHFLIKKIEVKSTPTIPPRHVTLPCLFLFWVFSNYFSFSQSVCLSVCLLECLALSLILLHTHNTTPHAHTHTQTEIVHACVDMCEPCVCVCWCFRAVWWNKNKNVCLGIDAFVCKNLDIYWRCVNRNGNLRRIDKQTAIKHPSVS